MPTNPVIDPRLSEWANATELRYIKAINEHGSGTKAAKALGCAKTAVNESMVRLRKRAALKGGYAPGHFESGIAPGFNMGKVTVQRGPGGEVERTWERQSPEDERQAEMFREFVAELCAEAKGKAPTIPAPAFVNSDLLTVYPIGDHHHGMYADPSETGDAYDAKISVHRLESAFDHLISLAPPSENALLINLGDFMHGNDSTNETEHGNRLDVDTRFGKVLHSGAMALVHCVLKLLAKHKTVHVWNIRGNHDRDAALALAMAMSFYFHDEPRVLVDMGSALYKYHRFGRVLIGSHHGHGAKAQDLPLIMAEDRKEDWGVTDHRVWHCGHIHHLTRRDYVGCTVETHRTLAGTDAWHAGQGYRSKKDMNAIVYHQHFGEIQRTRFDMSMVKAATAV
ncbi:MAG: LysR family transcriptional regulator [Massilia sp.]|nr:LysR family transcriptional regulator [Massilia sp.]